MRCMEERNEKGVKEEIWKRRWMEGWRIRMGWRGGGEKEVGRGMEEVWMVIQQE